MTETKPSPHSCNQSMGDKRVSLRVKKKHDAHKHSGQRTNSVRNEQRHLRRHPRYQYRTKNKINHHINDRRSNAP